MLQFTHLDLSNNNMTTLLKSESLRKQLFFQANPFNSQQSKKHNASTQSRKYKRKQSEFLLLENVQHLNVLNNFEVEDVQDFVD